MIDFITPQLIQRLAWSLTHFLWQGAVIAVFAAISLRLLARCAAEVRYAVAVAALVIMFAAPVATFVFYSQTGSLAMRLLRFAGDAAIISAGQTPAWTQWIVVAWFAGVTGFSVRLAIGWHISRRLRRMANIAVPDAISEIFRQTKTRLGFTKAVHLHVSARIDTPVVVGWLRPAVLLPLVAITGLSTEQLRAVLTHELAHIRRHDFLVNLLQRCVESLLFYHPAVWWLSARIRSQRENCCDDLVLQACGDRLTYARALVELERARTATPILAVGVTSGGLARRVARILGRDTASHDWQSAAAASLLVVVWLIAGIWQSNTLLAQTVPPVPPPAALGPGVVTPTQTSPVTTVARAILALAGPQTSSTLPAQQSAAASIEGVVLKLGTQEPIAGVTVELSRRAASNTPEVITRTTATDGKFAFQNLQPGDYRLIGAVGGGQRGAWGGYSPAEYGQRSLRGRGISIPLAAGQVMKDARLEMAATGSISGRITDRHGEPVGYARVLALEPCYQEGRRTMSLVQAVQTNDLGEYRLYWLLPGQYYIAVRPEDLQSPTVSTLPAPIVTCAPGLYAAQEGKSAAPVTRRTLDDGRVVEETYELVYYGGETNAQRALPVDLPAGANLNAVDISLTAGTVRARKVTGTVINAATGQPAAGARVTAYPRNPSPSMIMPGATASQNGSFSISRLTSEPYFLHATANGGLAAIVPLEAGSVDTENLAIVVSPGVTVAGRIVVDGPAPPDLDLTRLGIRITPDRSTVRLLGASGAAQGTVSADGTFTVRGVGPLGWDFQVEPGGTRPRGSYVKSIRMGSVELPSYKFRLDRPPETELEIVLGIGPGALDGRVLNDKQEPAINRVVLLAPDAPLRGRADLYKQAATDASGRFQIQDVVPGSYKVFAWDDVEAGAWTDPEFLNGFEARAQSVRIQSTSRETLDVMLIPSRK
jgi:beta-lactamase regulating signal transducer with metallopeptidase domain/5-hydroxyisourate hydrolase-like protein (transthyretin family)